MEAFFESLNKKSSFYPQISSNNQSDHHFVLNSLLEAKNEIGVFSEVFGKLSQASDSFIKFIIAETLEHKFYRHRSVVDSILAFFDIDFIPKDPISTITIINEIFQGDIQKYRDSDNIQHNYLLLVSLKYVSLISQNNYLDDLLSSYNKHNKLIAFHYLSLKKNISLSLLAEHFESSDVDVISVAQACLPYIHRNSKGEPSYVITDTVSAAEIFRKYCDIVHIFNKKDTEIKIPAPIWFTGYLGQSSLIYRLIDIALQLKDKSLFSLFESKVYQNLPSELKIRFINSCKEYISLDYRKEMLQFFSYYDPYSYHHKDIKNYFKTFPLSYDEAVIVSNYLKPKKMAQRKQIVEYFKVMNKNDQKNLKAYLENSPEDYKREAALDLLTDTTKLAEIHFQMPAVSYSRIKDKTMLGYLDRIMTFTKTHADEIFTDYMNNQCTFGSIMNSNASNLPLKDEFLSFISGSANNDSEMAAFIIEFFLINHSYSAKKPSKIISSKIDKYLKKGNNIQLTIGKYFPYVRQYVSSCSSGVIKREIARGVVSLLNILRLPNEESASIYPQTRNYSIEKEEWQILLDTTSSITLLLNLSTLDNDSLINLFNSFLYIKSKGKMKYLMNPAQKLPYLLYKNNLLSKNQIRALYLNNYLPITMLFTNRYISNSEINTLYLYAGNIQQDYIELIESIMIEMTEIEIVRSQSETIYSGEVSSSEKIFGIRFYLQALKYFQSATLPRSTWSFDKTKASSFANILSKAFPYKDDTYESFELLLKKLNLSKEDLIKGTLYNNNLTILEWTNRYLSVEGFISTVMFFKAHLRDTDVSQSVKEKIALYSPIDILDFKDGAVDIEWFNHCLSTVDKETFQIIYDNAKYITVANLHKRAQRFHDCLTNQMTLQECIDRINESRNKEYILYYSLIPKQSEIDIDNRYVTIMKFLQDSKQFGAQRQASEKKAVEIALENLGRLCGYDDPDRFVWYMESKLSHQSIEFFNEKLLDNIKVSLIIEDNYKVALSICKDSKAIKLPSSLKDHPWILELKAALESLNKQSSRIIKSFELAMEKETRLSIDELVMMSKSPLLHKILSGPYFVSNNSIKDLSGVLSSNDTDIYIAHPLDLLNLGVLNEKQNHLLKNNIRQPFKQVFREIYPKTIDELGFLETNRYHGHQISVQKAIAVSKNRGWFPSTELGLQKIFYKENIIAVIFGIWDFGYESFDDHPTLSSVFFLKRVPDGGARTVIPIKEISDKMFSEVMRDVDLIISTSHPMSYDYEESLSTVEVRRRVCLSLIELMGLTNTEISGNFVKIKGHFGDYNINLRSGVVSKQLKGALNVITINDSTKNRVFLSFIDDNPMTTEVITKMLLFSKDKDIKDPNILDQIKVTE